MTNLEKEITELLLYYKDCLNEKDENKQRDILLNMFKKNEVIKDLIADDLYNVLKGSILKNE